jgi:hypothetical protein
MHSQNRKITLVRNHWWCALVVPCFLASIVGCSDSLPETAPVKGIVTIDGKPISEFDNAAVIFMPPKGRPAKSVISKNDGSFELATYRTRDGARLGRHAVAVSATVNDASRSSEDKYSGVRFVIPEKFCNGETSGLTYKVEPGINNIEIQLNSIGTGKIIAK